MGNSKRNSSPQAPGTPPFKKKRFTKVQGRFGNSDKRLELLKNGTWSDFTITCQDAVFKVHRTVLIGNSSFLDSVLDGPFKETDNQQLDLSEGDASTVSMMLYYLYSGVFDFDAMGAATLPDWDLGAEKWLRLIMLHQLADFLLLADLKESCFRLLAQQLLCQCLDEGKKQPRKKGAPEPVVSEPGVPKLVAFIPDIVNYVFTVGNAAGNIKELIAWILMCQSDRSYDKQWISDAQMSTFMNDNLELGTYMYQSLMASRDYKKECCVCINPIKGHLDPRYTVVWYKQGKAEKARRWVDCRCNFRGLCSDACRCTDRKTKSMSLVCGNCKEPQPRKRRLNLMEAPCHLYVENGEITAKDPAAQMSSSEED